MNYNSLFFNYAVTLNTIDQSNTYVKRNTFQDGYDKQDKKIVINYYQLLTHVLFKSLIIITLLEII